MVKISEIELTMCVEKNLRSSLTVSKTIADESKRVRKEDGVVKRIERWFGFKSDVKWLNSMIIIIIHLLWLYHLCTIDFFQNFKTTSWIFVVTTIEAFGITGGVHRLWTHRAYKARLPLRTILYLCYATAGQNPVYNWVQDHRVHHKYTDTDADPHNNNRGIFFSHVGWLMLKKHPEVIEKGRQVDMSDIISDPVVKYGDKYFGLLKLVCCFIVPVLIPVYAWNETWYRSIATQIFIRYPLGLNATWSVNSLAHTFGSKPYDASINPAENWFVSFLTYGEGWHNYHHVFPWDYKAADTYILNWTSIFIDFFAMIGWAYDLKQPSRELVRNVMMKKGEDSHLQWDSVPHPDMCSN